MNSLESKPYAMRCACGAVFNLVLVPSLAEEFPVSPDDSRYRVATCNRCSEESEAAAGDADAQKRQASIANAKREAWLQVCPFEYRTQEEGGETDPALLDNVRLLVASDEGNQVLRWQDLAVLPTRKPEELDRPVVFLSGPSGSCKTRIAWRIGKAALDRHQGGTPLAFCTAWSFQQRIQDAAGQFLTGPCVGMMIEAPILALDDLGKVQWTDNTAAAFFEVLEQRIARRHLTVITTELIGPAVEAWFKSARSTVLASAADAIMRRLRQRGRVVLCTRKDGA